MGGEKKEKKKILRHEWRNEIKEELVFLFLQNEFRSS